MFARVCLKILFIPLMAYVSTGLISDCLVKLDEKFGAGCRVLEPKSSEPESPPARPESPATPTAHASDRNKPQPPNANNSTNHPIADTNEQVYMLI